VPSIVNTLKRYCIRYEIIQGRGSEMVDRLYVLVKGKKVEAVSIRTALEFLKVPFNISCSNMH